MKPRRRDVLALAIVLLAGCTGLGDGRTVHVDEAELQAQLARHFPLRKRLLGVFELELSTPRLRLLPQDNRLATAFVFVVDNRLNGRGVGGDIEFDFGLRWDAGATAIRLVQPHLMRFEARRHEADASWLRAAAPLLEAAFDDLVVYRVPPARLAALRAAGLQPGAITVTARGVDLRLDPIP